MSPRSIVASVLLVLCLIFLLQNLESTQVRFLFWYVAMPRALLLGVTVAIGVLIGLFLPRPKR